MCLLEFLFRMGHQVFEGELAVGGFGESAFLAFGELPNGFR